MCVVKLMEKLRLSGHCTFSRRGDKPFTAFRALMAPAVAAGASSKRRLETMGKLRRGARPLNQVLVLGLVAAAVAVPLASQVTPASAAAAAPAMDAGIAA